MPRLQKEGLALPKVKCNRSVLRFVFRVCLRPWRGHRPSFLSPLISIPRAAHGPRRSPFLSGRNGTCAAASQGNLWGFIITIFSLCGEWKQKLVLLYVTCTALSCKEKYCYCCLTSSLLSQPKTRTLPKWTTACPWWQRLLPFVIHCSNCSRDFFVVVYLHLLCRFKPWHTEITFHSRDTVIPYRGTSVFSSVPVSIKTWMKFIDWN